MRTFKYFILAAAIILFWLSCEKESYNPVNTYAARVVGYNQNCSTCIIEFLYNSSGVADIAGKSENNRYEAVNLNKNSYNIGEVIKCTLREIKPDEKTACLTMYPDEGYKSVFVEGVERSEQLNINDTVSLGYHNCYSDNENSFYLCLDSVVADSRCPLGFYCIWAGMVTARFKLGYSGNEPVYFELSSLRNTSDSTILPGYTIKLAGVDPYPVRDSRIRQEDYRVKLRITRL